MISPTGLVGSFTGTVSFAVPGVSLTGVVSAEIDTAAGDVLIDGNDLTFTVAGQEITADVTLERTAAADGSSRISVTLAELSFSIGSVVSVSGASGSLLIAADGIAGSFTATPVFTLPDSMTLTAVSIRIDVNTTPGAVVLSPSITLPAGPYVRAELSATLTFGTLGTLAGTLAFQRSQAPGERSPPSSL
ncbi:MAG: hypothetical protein IPL43_02525 [Micropruina sp.]|nr:hypothetical protein [Micropruina sp.]